MDEVGHCRVQPGGHQEPRVVSGPDDEALEGEDTLVAEEHLRAHWPAMNGASARAAASQRHADGDQCEDEATTHAIEASLAEVRECPWTR